MSRPQQVVDIGERGFRERAQRLAFDDDELVLAHALHPHAVGGKLAVGRGVGAEREQRGVLIRRGDGGGDVHGDFRVSCKIHLPAVLGRFHRYWKPRLAQPIAIWPPSGK